MFEEDRGKILLMKKKKIQKRLKTISNTSRTESATWNKKGNCFEIDIGDISSALPPVGAMQSYPFLGVNSIAPLGGVVSFSFNGGF